MFVTSEKRTGIMNHDCFVGYYFLEKGYDLWIGNNRGTTFARNHTYLDPNDDEFWKFSWHEMGIFDLPAIIDYILLHTQKHQLTYIGHSQSSTIIFVLLAERPNYNRKISSIHTMAPQVIPKYYHPLIAPIVPYLDDITVCSWIIYLIVSNFWFFDNY